MIYEFYREKYRKLSDNLTKEVMKVITPSLKAFKNLKQNLNFIENSGLNVNLAISKYSQTILGIFDSMNDFFSKCDYNDIVFVFLNCMSTSRNFPMKNYFTDFELRRLKIHANGMIQIKSEREQLLIVGGFVLVRILLVNIIFKLYKNEVREKDVAGARWADQEDLHTGLRDLPALHRGNQEAVLRGAQNALVISEAESAHRRR